MQYGKQLYKATLTLLTLTVCACGGGGGGSTSNTPNQNSSEQTSSKATSSTSSSAALSSHAISRADAPKLFSDYMDVILFSKSTAAAIVNEEYDVFLLDGSYKDSCEGGKGSYDITVSNSGDQYSAKYSNCLLTTGIGSLSTQFVYDGEISLVKTRREQTYSTAILKWSKFSVSAPGEKSATINGSLIYHGFLTFNPNANYYNTTAKVDTSIEIDNGHRTIKASNVNVEINYPAVFDRYDSVGGFFQTIEDPDFHLFTTKIVSATGTIELPDTAADFKLSPENLKLSFSNLATARAYAQATDQGFYLQWDEQNDGLLDANVFLTTNKYSALSDNLDSSNNQIDFTRYDQYYPTLPPNHYALGQYQPLNLSRGASVEINVQEIFTDTSGALLRYEIDNQTQSSDWEQLEAGRFKLTFPNSLGYETYELNLTAVDEMGNRSPAMKVSVKMNDDLADTDNDGVLDINDPDIDNDGVANEDDRFPKDPNESKDSDEDGIGDNSDTDIDGDGIANDQDAFPNDSNCYTEESGDALGCYLHNASYGFTDSNSIIYLTQQVIDENNTLKIRLIRFDTNTNAFLPASPILDLTNQMLVIGAYNKDYNSVLIQDNAVNKLYLLHLEDYSFEKIRDTTGYTVAPRLSDQGFFAVFVSQNQADKTWIEVYDNEGQLIDSSEPEPSSTKSVSFNLQHQIAVPFCGYAVTINDQGKLETSGNVGNADSDICFGTNQVSQNRLYTFGERNPLTNIYNNHGDIIDTIKSEGVFWLGNSLIYLSDQAYLSNGIYKLDLLKKEVGSSETTNFSKESTYLKNLDIVGDKVVTFLQGGYMTDSELRIFDSNLSPIYDSTNH